MNKIEDLVKQYCPNGVEYKKLSKICVRQKGTPITATIMKKLNTPQAPIRIFAGGNTFADVNYGDIPDKDIITKTSIIVKSRGNIGFEFYTKPFSHKNEMWSYSSNNKDINLKFVYYYLTNKINDFQLKAKTGKLPQISTPDTDNYLIPVPPLPVQEEIVKVLDAFTALEAELETELETELEARKRQYEYYRNKLLTFDENTTGKGVDWKMLSEVFVIQRGIRVTKNQLNDNGIYPVYQNSLTPLGYYTNANCLPDTTFIITAGAAGEIGYSSVAFWAADDCFYLIGSENINSRYVYHTLLNQQQYIKSRVRKASIPRLSRSIIEKIIIPIPPIEEQERIVAILDKFDSLVNDISEGLPAELTARRQQYEYYRNKLLTFEEAA